MQEFNNRTKLKLFVTQFLAPHPVELLSYVLISLLLLLISANQTLLVILSDGTPVTSIAITEVFGQRLSYINVLLSVPILGRMVLFLFWLAIGSIVYMFVWLFQNLAVEVYDDIEMAKLKDPKAHRRDEDDQEGWWGTALSHTIFVGSSVIVLLFYVIVAVNFLFPAWTQLFQIGLQTLTEAGGVFKLVVSVVGTVITVYIFVLFWRLFFRLKSYIYNSF